MNKIPYKVTEKSSGVFQNLHTVCKGKEETMHCNEVKIFCLHAGTFLHYFNTANLYQITKYEFLPLLLYTKFSPQVCVSEEIFEIIIM